MLLIMASINTSISIKLTISTMEVNKCNTNTTTSINRRHLSNNNREEDLDLV